MTSWATRLVIEPPTLVMTTEYPPTEPFWTLVTINTSLVAVGFTPSGMFTLSLRQRYDNGAVPVACTANDTSSAAKTLLVRSEGCARIPGGIAATGTGIPF